MSGKRLGAKPIAILVAVFLLGGAAGAATTWAVAVRKLNATMRHSPEKSRSKFRVEAMRRHLDLSDDQVTQLEVIFEKTGPEKEAALGGCKKKLDALREQVREEVDAVLTAEQRQKHKEMRARWRKRRGSASAKPEG